jgi:hypothetical protein
MNDKNKSSVHDFHLLMNGILKKRSKFGNRRTMNSDGTFSDSAKEARLDPSFMALAAAGARVIRKERFPIIINDVKVCIYEDDWSVYHKDGRREIYDAKGFKTAEYKLKKKLMKACFNIDIIEL